MTVMSLLHQHEAGIQAMRKQLPICSSHALHAMHAIHRRITQHNQKKYDMEPLLLTRRAVHCRKAQSDRVMIWDQRY